MSASHRCGNILASAKTKHAVTTCAQLYTDLHWSSSSMSHSGGFDVNPAQAAPMPSWQHSMAVLPCAARS